MNRINPTIRRGIENAWAIFVRDLRLSGRAVPASQERSLLNFACESEDPAQALVTVSTTLSKRSLRVRPSRLPARLPANYAKLAKRWQESLESARACGMVIGSNEAESHFASALAEDDPMMALLDVADAWCRLRERPPVRTPAPRTSRYADLLRRIQRQRPSN